MFLNLDEIELEAVCNTFSHVEQNIELHINYDKTTLYGVGSLANSDAQVYTAHNFKWSNENTDILGVKLSCTGDSVEENFTNVLSKVDVVTENWYKKTDSLIRKILIINALIGSLFVYKMSVMENLTEEQLNQIDNKIHTFLWSGKVRGRIAMETLKKDKGKGGLRLVDMKAKQKAIKEVCHN